MNDNSFEPETETPAPHRYKYFGTGVFGILAALVGWGGLIYVLLTIYPNGQTAREMLTPDGDGTWTYLANADSATLLVVSVLVILAVASISLPFTWFLSRRFTGDGLPRPWTITRQALWAGVFAAILVWLRANDTFSVPLMLITAGVLALVEVLMLLRQRGAAA